jgi:hypothetical protein
MDDGAGCLISLAATVISTPMMWVNRVMGRWRAVLARVAKNRGLTYRGGGLFGRSSASGTLDEGELTIATTWKMDADFNLIWMENRVISRLKLGVDVSIGRAGEWEEAAGQTEVQVGDPDFDTKMTLVGDELELLSRLDAHTRKGLLEAVDGGTAVTKGTIQWVHGQLITDTAVLEAGIDKMVAIGALLTTDVPLLERLAHNAVSDPLPGVRTRNLRLWIDKGGDDVEFLRARLEDDSSRVRLVAAEAMGEDGLATLCDLVEDDDGLVAVRALNGIEAWGDLSADVIARGELTLRRLLTKEDTTVQLRTSAIEVLGRIGGVGSVEVLMLPRQPSQPAKKAIATIQGRQPDAERGRLALAEVSGGELDVARDAGALSVVDKA